jgi:hypothetical protein
MTQTDPRVVYRMVQNGLKSLFHNKKISDMVKTSVEGSHIKSNLIIGLRVPSDISFDDYVKETLTYLYAWYLMKVDFKTVSIQVCTALSMIDSFFKKGNGDDMSNGYSYSDWEYFETLVIKVYKMRPHSYLGTIVYNTVSMRQARGRNTIIFYDANSVDVRPSDILESGMIGKSFRHIVLFDNKGTVTKNKVDSPVGVPVHTSSEKDRF